MCVVCRVRVRLVLARARPRTHDLQAYICAGLVKGAAVGQVKAAQVKEAKRVQAWSGSNR